MYLRCQKWEQTDTTEINTPRCLIDMAKTNYFNGSKFGGQVNNTITSDQSWRIFPRSTQSCRWMCSCTWRTLGSESEVSVILWSRWDRSLTRNLSVETSWTWLRPPPPRDWDIPDVYLKGQSSQCADSWYACAGPRADLPSSFPQHFLSLSRQIVYGVLLLYTHCWL